MSLKVKFILIISIPIIILILWILLISSFIKKGPKQAVNTSEIKNQTGNIMTDNIITGFQEIKTEPKNEIKKEIKAEINTEINVLIPEFFDNKGWNNLKTILAQNNKINIKYKYFQNLTEYQDYLNNNLSGNNNDNIDIFLIPSDWLDTYKNQGFKFDLSKDIASFFHYVFINNINAPDYTFIPYALDPFVILISKEINFDSREMNFKSLKDALLTNNQKNKPYLIPILFGIGPLDISLLKKQNQSYENYFLILFNFIFQANSSKNYEAFDFFINFVNNSQIKFRSYPNMIKLIKKINLKNPNCEIYKSICIISNGFGNISLGFLSDLDIMNKYFSNANKSESDLEIYNFLLNSDTYLVRGWGFLINKNSKKTLQASVFINEYLKQILEGNSSYWSNTLSAFNNILDKQRIQNKYEKVLKYENKFQLLQASINLQNDFTSRTKFIDYLENKSSAQAFFSQLDWKF